MFRLPDTAQLNSTQVNNPEVNANAMAAPAQALNGLGRELVGVSDQFFGTAVKLQQIENARIVSEKQLKLQEDWSKHSLEMQRVNDPAKQIEMAHQFFESNAGMVDDPNLPPAVRAELSSSFSQFRTKQTMATAENAARLEIRRSTLAMQNEVDAALRNNDMATAEAAINRMAGSGLILPEEAQKIRVKAKEQIALNQHQTGILADATGWLEHNPSDKVPDDIDPGQWATLHKMARRQQREQVIDDTEGVLDMLHSGRIANEQDLEKVAGHLPPSVRARLTNQLEIIQRDDYERKIRTPEYQHGVVGKVMSMLAGYNPAEDGYDSAYVEIDSAIRTLPEGNSVRNELARQLREKRDPDNSSRETGAYRYATDSLAAATKAGRFGIPDASFQPVEKAINDGFLRDTKKMEQFFTPEQIAELNAKVIVGKDKERDPTDRERRDRFERMWINRKPSAKPDPYALATAEAIVNQESVIPNEKEIARVESVHRRVGEVRMRLAEWTKMHPNATPAEIDAKVRELAGGAARSAALQSLLPPAPKR